MKLIVIVIRIIRYLLALCVKSTTDEKAYYECKAIFMFYDIQYKKSINYFSAMYIVAMPNETGIILVFTKPTFNKINSKALPKGNSSTDSGR